MLCCFSVGLDIEMPYAFVMTDGYALEAPLLV